MKVFLDILNDDADAKLRITNIISNYDLELKELDLKRLSERLRTATYHPTQHAALRVLIRKHKTTASISSSGKVSLTGSKSVLDAKNAANFVCEILKRVGYPQVSYAKRRFKVSNINGTANLGFELDTPELYDDHKDNATYEPAIFPGLIYRLENPSIVVNVFTSGKYTLSGAKTEKELRQADKLIQVILRQYDKKKILEEKKRRRRP